MPGIVVEELPGLLGVKPGLLQEPVSFLHLSVVKPI
jgi:hypothetical protein